MTDYNKYSYSYLLLFLDGCFESDTENKNYAEFLLKMEHAKSLNNLFKIYKKVYAKMLYFLHTKDDKGHKELDENLNECLNENIVRLLYSKEHPDLKFCVGCLANIRQCASIKKYQNLVIDYTAKFYSVEFDNISREIIEAQIKYSKALDDFYYGYLEIGTNGFKRMKKELNSNFEILTKNGYIPVAYDRRFISLFWERIVPAIILIVLVIFLQWLIL